MDLAPTVQAGPGPCAMWLGILRTSTPGIYGSSTHHTGGDSPQCLRTKTVGTAVSGMVGDTGSRWQWTQHNQDLHLHQPTWISMKSLGKWGPCGFAPCSILPTVGSFNPEFLLAKESFLIILVYSFSCSPCPEVIIFFSQFSVDKLQE